MISGSFIFCNYEIMIMKVQKLIFSSNHGNRGALCITYIVNSFVWGEGVSSGGGMENTQH